MREGNSSSFARFLNATLDISFIILSWNSARFLKGCLSTLQADLKDTKLSFEVLLVDNGSKDDSCQILERFRNEGYPLLVIPLGHNTGTTFSRNIGLRMAKGRYICVLDSDIEFCQKNTLESLIAILEKDPITGLVAPQLKYPSGNYQKTFDQFPTLTNKLKRLFFLRRMERMEGLRKVENQNQVEVDYVISAFWLFRREMLTAVGLLDEKIFYAPEDVDFCLRIWLSGFRVLFCGDVQAIHLAQEISRKRPWSKSGRMHVLGLIYFFRKYGYCLSLKGLHGKIAQVRMLGEKDTALSNFQGLPDLRK